MNTALPLSLALLLSVPVSAQIIPNGDFEDWTDQGDYPDPTGWLTSNIVSWAVDGTLTCEQGTPAPEGDRYVMVTDRLLNGVNMQQASITIGQMGSPLGFPFTQRPDALNGLWQYHPQNGGTDGVVNATLTRWNTVTDQREYIANAPLHVTTAITEWQAFSSPFLYYSDATPDSAIVSIQATNAQAGDGTSIWVDDLSFGAVQSVQEQTAEVLFALSPSPATDHLYIRASGALAEVHIQDLSGRLVRRVAVNNQAMATVELDALPAGLFIARVRLMDGRLAARPFVKD